MVLHLSINSYRNHIYFTVFEICGTVLTTISVVTTTAPTTKNRRSSKKADCFAQKLTICVDVWSPQKQKD